MIQMATQDPGNHLTDENSIEVSLALNVQETASDQIHSHYFRNEPFNAEKKQRLVYCFVERRPRTKIVCC